MTRDPRERGSEQPGPWLHRTVRQAVSAWLQLEADERERKTRLGHHDESQAQRPDSGPGALLHVYCHASEALSTRTPFPAVVEATDVGVGSMGETMVGWEEV